MLLPSYRLRFAKAVLINVGKEYSLAEAFIVLSLNKRLKIFVTVDSEEDAVSIQNRFPEVCKSPHSVDVGAAMRPTYSFALPK